MTKSPRKGPTSGKRDYASKTNKNIARKRNRRFSIVSNSDSNSSDDGSSDSDDSSSSSNYDDEFYRTKQRNNAINLNPIASSGGSDDDDYSSTSDDENVDFVQLTKERRAKAMKAVKGLKKTRISNDSSVDTNSTSTDDKQDNSNPDEEELDDDLVDAVIEKEERKMKGIFDSNNNSICVSDKEGLLNDNLDDIDFKFDFDSDNNQDGFQISNKSKSNTITELENEDIGEEVENIQSTIPSINQNDNDDKVTLDVPRFGQNEIDSDADYEFDQDDLIQTLMNDNDDLELQQLDNTDDDFDFLIANQQNSQSSNFKEPSLKINQVFSKKDHSNDDANDEADSDFLMQEETQAMLDDYNDFSASQDSTPRNSISTLRRGSMVNNDHNHNHYDGLDLEFTDFDDIVPKRQILRRRSSILAQPVITVGDEVITALNKKKNKRRNTKHNQMELDNSNLHTKAEIKKILGDIDNDDYNSDAVLDSEDDSHLIQYFFSGGSDSASTSSSSDILNDNDGNETDEDITIPKHVSGKQVGIKHAKEVLSSSTLSFRAPFLGTFITTKPYGVIDGLSTRFLYPKDNQTSILKNSSTFIRSNNGHPHSNLHPHISPRIQQDDAIELDELLNISEFEDGEIEQSHSTFDIFNEKRIPLTAFRNRGVVNVDVGNTARKYSFGEKKHKHKHSKKSDSKSKSKVKFNSSLTQAQALGGLVVQKKTSRPIANDVLLIGVNPMIKKKRSMSRSNNKTRMRRASMVEAQAEGLRPTKNGLFSEEVVNDVETLLMDIGTNDDYSFLFGADI